MAMGIRYLTSRYKELYYLRAVPLHLRDAIGKKNVSQKLGLKIGSSNALITAKIAELDEQYQAWFDSIESDNTDLISEITRRNAALAYLSEHGLKEGELAPLAYGTPSDHDAYDQYLSSVIDDKFDGLSELGYKHSHKLPLTPSDLVMEYAWILATKPQSLQLPAKFSDAWNFYVKIKKFDFSIRSHLKHKQFWDRFIHVSGDLQLSSKNIREAQAAFAEHHIKKGNKAQSFKRAIAPVLAAFNAYIEENQLDIQVKRYKLQQVDDVQERLSIDEKQLSSLWKLVRDDKNNFNDDIKLSLILMMQSSLIASELQHLKLSDLVVKGHPNFEGIPYIALRTGKTKQRVRPVPLVVGIDLIERLTAKVTDGNYLIPRISSQTESSFTNQLNQVIKLIDNELTSYSLRHGWLDRAYNKDAPESLQDRVGGWSGSGSNSKKRGYAKLADTSPDRLKVYATWQQRINSCLLAENEKVIGLFG